MRPRSLLFDISRPLISVRHHQYSITLLVCATWAFYMSVWLDIGRGYRSAADFYVYTVRLSTESTRAHGERASWIPSKRRNALLARPLSHRALSLSLSYRAFIYVWVASLLERDRDQSYRIPGRGVGDPLHAISRLESSHHPDSRWARYFYTGGSSKKWERIIRRSIASRD